MSSLIKLQQHQWLAEWNNTQTNFSDDKCIHQLFEAQVERSPNAIAVVFEESCLTYQELNQQANRLGHYLKKLGVGPEILVSIYMERSLEIIIGLLGILKAGGAYVPLDPIYPRERLAFMLEDTQTPVLLTQKNLQTKFFGKKVRVLSLDAHWEIISKERDNNLNSGVKPNNLAYVIYTSGSTGKPKGVCCNHLGIVNLLADFDKRKPLSVGDKCSLWTSINFDVSVYEIFSALLAGGALHIIPNDVRSDTKQCLEWFSSQKICSAYIPPFMLAELSNCLKKLSGKLYLRRLLVGVEPILESLLISISEHVKGLQIINGYGPTEATVCSSLYSLPSQCTHNRNTPIGKPVQNTQLYVLDEELQPVSMGSVGGELYIGGVGLARGYLNRPELTAEKFIPDPFSDDPNARLYKTGDLVRYLPDGNLEFVGRIDHQVKIRGFRIELGEIETILNDEPSVQQAVVVVRKDDHGNKHLIAYIVSNLMPERLSVQDICLIEFDDDSLIALKTEDISHKGARLVGVPPTVTAGQSVRLCMQIPTVFSSEKWLKGRVAWCEDQQAGIQFTISATESGAESASPCKNVEELLNKIDSGNVEVTLGQEEQFKENAIEVKYDESCRPKITLKRLPIQSDCLAEYASHGQLIPLKTENISYNGVRVVNVPPTWLVGQNVCLFMQLPQVDEELCLEGSLVWCQENRAGIQFSNASKLKMQVCQAVEKLFKNHKILDVIQRTSVAAQHLRHFLTEKLPAYMLPSNFVFIKNMPLTPNGKIDRKALAAPDHNYPDLIEEDFEVAHTPIEETLAGIWADVLKIEQVSIHDDFVGLGGDSLLAAQIITRLHEVFQVELPLHSLFEWPTIAKLAKCIDAFNNQEKTFHSVVPPLIPITDKTDIPLSFSQQQIWLQTQIAPDAPVYNEPFTIRFSTPINVTVLEQSFNEILHRHEALRTTFTTVYGQPVQVVVPFKPFSFSMRDLRDLSANEREPIALQSATKEAKQSFDLSKYPLFRATLFQLDEKDYRLFFTFHHIIIDGVSLYNIFLSELSTLYQAFSQEKSSPLLPLSVQYTDFAIWQRQWLQAEVLQVQWFYWKQQLENLTALQLPTDRPYPAIPTFRGAKCCLAVSKVHLDALKELGRQEGVTLFVVLLTVFKTLLYRYTGQHDIVVGTVTAGRNRAELKPMIGYFLNTLVLRTDFSDNLTFHQLLHRVREITVAAVAHQDLPFEQLVNALQPERSLSANPLFQVMFDLDPPISTLDLDWELSQLDIQTDTAKFDLTMELDERADGMIGRIEYNTDLFDEATIIRMIDHYQTLLEGIIAKPEQPISHLPLLTEREEEQLLKWNNTQTDFPVDACIHQLFERQVERSPDAVALVFEEKQLTYRELNCRANQLAHYLISLGLKPETLVGICVERSLEMIIGLLGIFKAGGAYVPLDPAYPQERLAFMLEDAQMPILLTQSSLIDQLPSHQAQIICLDINWQTISKQSVDNPKLLAASGHLAYVIYTSGSTGQPKGVMMEHRGLCNLTTVQNQIFNLQSNNRILQFASINFDSSLWEIVMALLSGSALYLGTRSTMVPGNSLVRLLREQAITIATLPPSALAVLPVEKLPALHTIIIAGEACSAKLAARWICDNRRLFNGYGPTETTVGATIAEITKIDDNLNISIGYPFANTQVYVLDAHLQQVPIGILGELHVGGVGLARGYLNRSELTNEKFIPNPFSSNPNARLYKTGDLARYLPNGSLEFLGRIDHQVKIRGFRIELGEIEAVLSQHAIVQEVIVIAREDTPNDKRLVAYVVVKPHQKFSTTELRQFIQKKLPDYMVPSTFVLLESLPLTPNGKIDRQALPQPEEQRADLEASYTAPQSDIEQKMATFLQSVLHVDQVGIHDNFFDLGGNSLLLVQVQEKLEKVLNQDVPVVALFQHPTIDALTHYLEPSITPQSSDQNAFQEADIRASKKKDARHKRQERRKKHQ